MFSKFAVNEIKTIETDRRRLEFIASWFEELIVNDCRQLAAIDKSILKLPILARKFLKELVEYRQTNFESCNMILILLVVWSSFFVNRYKKV
jgi:hypothetical protein